MSRQETLESLAEEVQEIPDILLNEVLDFLRFLKATRLEEGQPERIDLSKTAFGEDWDRLEEDEAWRDL